jgi:hypothetical protein
VDNGTAHFTAKVGDTPVGATTTSGGAAAGAANSASGGDKSAFCSDNATIDQATSAAKDANGFVQALKDNQSTLADFQKNAPSDIANDATALVNAANDAIAKNDASQFENDQNLQASGHRVDVYCGQNPDGSPATTTTTG